MITWLVSPLWWLFAVVNLASHVGALTISWMINGNHALWLMQQYGRAQLGSVLCRLEVTGLDRVPSEGGVLFAANHKSYFDIYALLATCPRSLRWVLKESLFKMPFLGAFLRQSHAIGLNREQPARAARALVAGIKDLRAGEAFVVFPEGTRIAGEELGDFKGGGFQLALKSGRPVIPVAIHGSSKVLPPRRLTIFLFQTIRIEYLEPVDPAEFGSDRDAFAEHVKARIAESLSRAKNSDINNVNIAKTN